MIISTARDKNQSLRTLQHILKNNDVDGGVMVFTVQIVWAMPLVFTGTTKKHNLILQKRNVKHQT